MVVGYLCVLYQLSQVDSLNTHTYIRNMMVLRMGTEGWSRCVVFPGPYAHSKFFDQIGRRPD